MAKTTSTKKPTGLSIKRDVNKFICSWKIGDKNYSAGQQFQWRTNKTKKGTWNTASISAKATSHTVTISFTDAKTGFIPTTKRALTGFRFRVRGQRGKYSTGSGKNEVKYDPTWSDWSPDEFVVKVPDPPKVSVSLSETYSNRSTFSWNASHSDSSHQNFRRVEWESVLLKNSTVTDGKKAFGEKRVAHSSGTGSASGSQVFTEDTTYINGADSYVRWFRAISVGVAGHSQDAKGKWDWTYKKHVYARPFKGQNLTASAVKSANGYRVTAEWTTESTVARPIDTVTVQYAVTTPDSGMGLPSGTGFEDAMVVKSKDGSDKAVFDVDDSLGADQVIFVRIATQHDTLVNYSPAVIAIVGKLEDPTLTSAVIDSDTHRAVVTASNATSVPDAKLAVTYKTTKNPNNVLIIGVFGANDPSITVQAPDWGANSVAFGVKSIVGDAIAQTRSDGVTIYSFEPYEGKQLMESDAVWDGGTVPKAPTGVTVTPTETTGTVRVTWNCNWTEAQATEISWADHEDAWMSTEQPSNYIVSNVFASAWNISGLEVGKDWYVRVRLLAGTSEDSTASPWSDIIKVSLSSAPNIPSLTLSQASVAQDGTVTASWAYASTDGTPQALAELCEVTDPTQMGAEYVLTQDTTVQIKDYYVRSGSGTAQDPYVWTVKNLIDYTATTDSTVTAGKNYYKRTGSGTASDPYAYTLVTNPTGNPSAKGWYETDGTSTADPSGLGLYELNHRLIARTTTAQHIDVKVSGTGWQTGQTYYLSVRNTSRSGQTTDWSDPVPIAVAEPLTAVLASSPFVTMTIDGETVTALDDMPLTLTVTGAGATGTTRVAIERAESYYLERPDETSVTGHVDETIALYSQLGEDQISIENEDLIGTLDDGAPYRLIATVEDGLGQSDTLKVDFEVHWQDQALIPTANVTIDQTDLVAFIEPIAPEDAQPDDKVDIYRLSVDRPELIVAGADFGTVYVDPYPTLGEYCGYRIVYRTANGDYITEDNTLAWTDYKSPEIDMINTKYNVIDFGGQQLRVMFDIKLDSSWTKDFQETKYLGGSITGDWTAGVSRSGSVAGSIISSDTDTIQTLRRLADYSGICHVRTREGSSYSADVQVSESRDMAQANYKTDFSLTITRVDPEGLDGLSYAEWTNGESE